MSLRLNNKPDAMDLYPSLLISGDGCSSLSESAGISRAVGESTVCSISEVAVPCLEGITGVNSCEILKGVELVEVWSSIVLTSLLNACALPSPVFVLSQAGELMECPKGAVLFALLRLFRQGTQASTLSELHLCSATNGGAFVGILCWMCPDSFSGFGGTLGAADCTEASCGLSGWVSLCFGHFSTSFSTDGGTLNL